MGRLWTPADEARLAAAAPDWAAAAAATGRTVAACQMHWSRMHPRRRYRRARCGRPAPPPAASSTAADRRFLALLLGLATELHVPVDAMITTAATASRTGQNWRGWLEGLLQEHRGAWD